MSSMWRCGMTTRQRFPRRLLLTLAVLLAAALCSVGQAQDQPPNAITFATAVSKSGRDLELRSAGRFLRDQVVGHAVFEPEAIAPSSPSVTTGPSPLSSPNTQVNDPALDNIQLFPSFAPFLHYTQSETTVAAAGQNIVVSYNNSAGATLVRTPKAG